MKLVVDPVQRHAKMRAHTATHLLHFALGELLGSTKQAGSLVDEDYLRFDFAAKQPLDHQQIQTIESKVNHWIRHAREVNVTEMSLEEANKTGAKAFFEDKYGDQVRVVSIVDNDISLSSIELCGGTHVPNTLEIGAFLITGQEAVASGIRRITAVTWPAVALHAQTLSHELLTISTKLDCQPKQLQEKLDKFLKELTHLQENHTSLQNQVIKNDLQQLSLSNNIPITWFTYVINISDSDLSSYEFKIVVTQAKVLRPTVNRIIYTNEGNFALSTGENGSSAKAFAQKNGLKWGGSEHLVQWRDLKILEIL